MNRKLKMALRRRSSEQGFALPIAVGIGLIMLLVGVTMIVRSQGDQVTASAQKATADSLGVAETGVTRVHAFLKKFPNLPAQNPGSWPASLSTSATTINVSGSSCGGGGAGTINVLGATTKDNELLTAIKASPPTWISVDSADLSKGEFKVLSYTVAAGKGTLRVEGRASSESSAATTKIGNATTVVKVEIPVTAITSSAPTPAIWVGGTNPPLQFPIDVSTTASIKGCVLAVAQALLPLDPLLTNYDNNKMGLTKFAPNTPAYTFTRDTLPMPALPAPVGILNTTLAESVSSNTTILLPQNGDINSLGVTYSTSNPATLSGTYNYKLLNGLSVSAGSAVQISPGVKVILFLNKDLNISGNLNNPGSATSLEIYGSGGIRNYGYPLDLTKDRTTQINFNQGKANAFIYAPAATANINQGQINGSIWTNEFKNGSNVDNPIALEFKDVGTTLVAWPNFGVGGVSTVARIGPIQSWQRQEKP